jgi:curli biogenesis system outer membrane secretion channel CsgG
MQGMFVVGSTFVCSMLLMLSCATVSTEKSAQLKQDNKLQNESYPEYTGEKKRVQIIRFGIPPEITAQYPELAEKRVGWGLYNVIIDEFYDSKRFTFIEEKEAIQEKIMQNWALSQSGIVVEEQQVDQSHGLSLPQYLVYAEIVDFSVRTKEVVVGVAMQKENATQIGVQLRIVDVSTGEYIPGSGMGEATTTARTVWIQPDQQFDQSTVGLATKRAVHAAVLSMIKKYTP